MKNNKLAYTLPALLTVIGLSLTQSSVSYAEHKKCACEKECGESGCKGSKCKDGECKHHGKKDKGSKKEKAEAETAPAADSAKKE